MSASEEFYARDGERLTLEQWGALQSDFDYAVVKKDTIQGVEVSTVWLGINHQWKSGPPLIFETMTFTDLVLEWSDRQWRYTTEDEAISGHESICAELRVMLHLIQEEEEVLDGD